MPPDSKWLLLLSWLLCVRINAIVWYILLWWPVFTSNIYTLTLFTLRRPRMCAWYWCSFVRSFVWVSVLIGFFMAMQSNYINEQLNATWILPLTPLSYCLSVYPYPQFAFSIIICNSISRLVLHDILASSSIHDTSLACALSLSPFASIHPFLGLFFYPHIISYDEWKAILRATE